MVEGYILTAPPYKANPLKSVHVITERKDKAAFNETELIQNKIALKERWG